MPSIQRVANPAVLDAASGRLAPRGFEPAPLGRPEPAGGTAGVFEQAVARKLRQAPTRRDPGPAEAADERRSTPAPKRRADEPRSESAGTEAAARSEAEQGSVRGADGASDATGDGSPEAEADGGHGDARAAGAGTGGAAATSPTGSANAEAGVGPAPLGAGESAAAGPPGGAVAAGASQAARAGAEWGDPAGADERGLAGAGQRGSGPGNWGAASGGQAAGLAGALSAGAGVPPTIRAVNRDLLLAPLSTRLSPGWSLGAPRAARTPGGSVAGAPGGGLSEAGSAGDAERATGSRSPEVAASVFGDRRLAGGAAADSAPVAGRGGAGDGGSGSGRGHADAATGQTSLRGGELGAAPTTVPGSPVRESQSPGAASAARLDGALGAPVAAAAKAGAGGGEGGGVGNGDRSGSGAATAAGAPGIGTREPRTARGEAAASAGAGRATADAAELLRAQVGRALAGSVRQGGGSVSMRLVPEHLGQLRVHVDLRGAEGRGTGRGGAGVGGAAGAGGAGGAGGSVRIEVGSEEARRLLSESADELKALLRERGVPIERVSVRLEAALADPGGLVNGTAAGATARASEHATEHDAAERWTGGSGRQDEEPSDGPGEGGPGARGRRGSPAARTVD